MASKNREYHIIQSVACPICKAKAGEPCDWSRRDPALQARHNARLAVHGERRKAWQAAGNPKAPLD